MHIISNAHQQTLKESEIEWDAEGKNADHNFFPESTRIRIQTTSPPPPHPPIFRFAVWSQPAVEINNRPVFKKMQDFSQLQHLAENKGIVQNYHFIPVAIKKQKALLFWCRNGRCRNHSDFFCKAIRWHFGGNCVLNILTSRSVDTSFFYIF